MTSHGDRHILVPMGQKDTLNEKLDEAVEESFPVNDPVSLGHRDHVGQPKSVPKRNGKLPKGSTGLEEKRSS